MLHSIAENIKYIRSFLFDALIRRFDCDYAICVIIKNEADYIEEWIDYHFKIGFEKFYIYDNESTDNTREILDKYIRKGIVDYIYCPGKGKQIPSYNDCIHRYRSKCRYIAFIDADEFIFPIEDENIYGIKKYLDKYAGLTINWMIFGSSHHIKKPEGSVLENYTLRGKEANKHVKTICNPRWVDYFNNPHFPRYVIKKYSVDENYKRVDGPFNEDLPAKSFRINHYYCKSQEEGIRKHQRGFADYADDRKKPWSNFIAHDLNEVFDDSILKIDFHK